MVNSPSAAWALIFLIAIGARRGAALRRSGVGVVGIGEEEDVMEMGGGEEEEGGRGREGRARGNEVDDDREEDRSHDHRNGGGGGCSGGCGSARGKLRARPVLLSPVAYQPAPERELDTQPRPLFGLIGNILETVRYGRDIDDRRPHIFF